MSTQVDHVDRSCTDVITLDNYMLRTETRALPWMQTHTPSNDKALRGYAIAKVQVAQWKRVD